MSAAATLGLASEAPLLAAVRLRLLRRVLWQRAAWAARPPGLDPAAVTEEEVDRALLDPGALAAAEARFAAEDPDSAALAPALAEAEAALERDARWAALRGRLGLDRAEAGLLALAVAVAGDAGLGRVCAWLHDHPGMPHATPRLAAALAGPGARPVLPRAGGALLRWSLLRPAEEAGADAPEAGWHADRLVTAWLLGEAGDALPPGCVLFRAEDPPPEPVLQPALLEDLLAFRRGLGDAPGMLVELVGPPGSGRRALARQVAAAAGLPLVSGRAPADLLLAQRAARLHGALLHWDLPEPPPAAAEDAPRAAPAIALLPGIFLLLARAPGPPPALPEVAAFRSLEVPPPTAAARLHLWRSLLAGPPPRQVAEWSLTPAEILRIRRVAGAGPEAVLQACRRPSAAAGLLSPMPLPYGPGDLVLPETVAEQLAELEAQVRLRAAVLEEWGFARLCPGAPGLVALFAGPSGTGKTMAAQVLARSLGMELWRLDAATVVNKYIGETEKRLRTVFDALDGGHFLLLVDECEGLFGQRFASRDAHDRYANLEIDYLLQRLERLRGVAILATNRKSDLDAAFQRRLRIVIDFLPPGPAERRRLWREALGAGTPDAARLLDGVEFDALGERLVLTGAEIKLAALNAAFMARAAGTRIGMREILRAARRELAKKGQGMRGFDAPG